MTGASFSTPWLARAQPNPRARLRLFCFPYAGGSSVIFREWQNRLPVDIEVCPVQPPGRGGRLREAPFTRVGPLVAECARALSPYFDKPFAFFGHSKGAVVAFELARWLRRMGHSQPAIMFVSGRRAPQFSDAEHTYDLPDEAFIAQLRDLNGTPKEVLEHPEMMELLLPLLRADFELIQTYVYTPEAPLACPIAAFGGLGDEETNGECLEAWREQTTGRFSLQMLPGDHFFLHSARPLLLEALARRLTERLENTI
jgi:medium-chain acyl-[acyl-carrier-protein] hydrolase